MDPQRIKIGIYLASGLIILVIVFATLLIYNNENGDTIEPNCKTPIPVQICATPDLDSIAREGKDEFNNYCAACHKRFVKATGPALDKIDIKIFWKWMDTTKQKVDSTKLDEMGIDYHNNFASEKLTKSQLENILKYID